MDNARALAVEVEERAIDTAAGRGAVQASNIIRKRLFGPRVDKAIHIFAVENRWFWFIYVAVYAQLFEVHYGALSAEIQHLMDFCYFSYAEADIISDLRSRSEVSALLSTHRRLSGVKSRELTSRSL